ncbi:MAG: hypothetical protein CM15mP81_12050 [Alphaproteobacteria bacterium]|nr:MAG: hypothetical protein CM15mP81_12050 [Alphaproteobacteria bacterium]
MKNFYLLQFFSFLLSLSSAFAGTVIIESWRNDDADAWNEKIIPAFNAKYPNIE